MAKTLSFIRESKSKNSSFRLRAKNLFLTYSQLPAVDDIVEQVRDQLKEILKRNDMGYLISKELHEDGNPHIHVFLSFDTPIGVYSATKLDLELTDSENNAAMYHGKYESVKNKHSTIQYLLKEQGSDDSIIDTNIDLPIHEGKYYSDPFDHLCAVLTDKGIESAIELLYEKYQVLALQKGSQLVKNLTMAANYRANKKMHASVKIRALKDFLDIPSEITDWMNDPNRKTLVLHGPSGTGKTELAKAMLNDMGLKHIFIRDINALKGFCSATHEAIIFDDLPVDDMPTERLIHICDTDNISSIRILYATIEIPPSTQKIFTTNRPLNLTRNDMSIKRRIKLIKIDEPLFARVGYSDTPPLTIAEKDHDEFLPSLTTSIQPSLDGNTSSLDDNTSSLDDNSSLNSDDSTKEPKITFKKD